MKLIIKESKIQKIVFDYLDNEPLLNNLKSSPAWNPESTNYYPQFESEDYPDYSFSYFPSQETYDYPDTYEEDMFPMIEVNYDIWGKLEDIFGEKMVTEFLLKWINSRYDLNAVSVNAG